MTLEEIIKRLKEIGVELGDIAKNLNDNGDNMTEDQVNEAEARVNTLTTEKRTLETQKAQLEGAQNTQARRSQLLNSIATGATASTSFRSFAPAQTPAAPVDRFDTTEYRTAFMNFVCRNVAIPVEYRANEITGVADASAVIPTTIMNEIVEKLEAHGNIYALVRKLNVQGGVAIPILSLKPTATWLGDKAASDTQKLTANTSVTFNYFGVECKISQSLLSNVVSLKMFNDMFVPLCVEAIVKAVEIAVFKGDGTTQPLGVTIDTRVPSENVVEMTDKDMTWKGWKSKVFAKMKKAYRNGIFAMAQGTFDGYIDGMTDTTGQPIGRVNYGVDGEEKYRFGGKIVETVEDDVIANFDDASAGDVVAVFFNPKDYGINSNMQLTTTKWYDNDTNEYKTKVILICDGKLIDANGVIIVKKKATA